MTLAELSVPMLVVAPTQEATANPEVVRLVALARAGDRVAFGRNRPGAFRGWFMRVVWRKALDRRRSMTVLLQSATPLIVSQAADPITDRKIVVEVKATVLK